MDAKSKPHGRGSSRTVLFQKKKSSPSLVYTKKAHTFRVRARGIFDCLFIYLCAHTLPFFWDQQRRWGWGKWAIVRSICLSAGWVGLVRAGSRVKKWNETDILASVRVVFFFPLFHTPLDPIKGKGRGRWSWGLTAVPPVRNDVVTEPRDGHLRPSAQHSTAHKATLRPGTGQQR